MSRICSQGRRWTSLGRCNISQIPVADIKKLVYLTQLIVLMSESGYFYMSTWSFDLFMDKVTGTHLEKYLFFYIPSTPTNCVKEFTEIYKI